MYLLTLVNCGGNVVEIRYLMKCMTFKGLVGENTKSILPIHADEYKGNISKMISYCSKYM